MNNQNKPFLIIKCVEDVFKFFFDNESKRIYLKEDISLKTFFSFLDNKNIEFTSNKLESFFKKIFLKVLRIIKI
jgi:hypothetical protein